MTALAPPPPALPACLAGVPLLREQRLGAGQLWLYSAGFNVGPELADTTRIDSELGDLARLAAAGARVVLLAHQGSRRERTAHSLEYLAGYLEGRLRRPVEYLADPLGPGAAARLARLGDGEIVVAGNTRLLDGEESDDPALARELAGLGERVAVGGFSKAHRAHASNVGLLRHLPGCAADSLVAELVGLEPWRLTGERFSVAAVGGLKAEKIDPGFLGFAQSWDLVIPGGAVLNALLAARGHEVGDSDLGGCRRAAAAAAALVERGCRADVHLPERIVIAPLAERRPERARTIAVEEGVPAGHAIVDFELRPETATRLRRLREGRMILAGPPGLYAAGFRRATAPLLEAMAAPGVEALLLGGDSVAELPWDGPVSAGGGSALVHLSGGELPVLAALAASGGRP